MPASPVTTVLHRESQWPLHRRRAERQGEQLRAPARRSVRPRPGLRPLRGPPLLRPESRGTPSARLSRLVARSRPGAHGYSAVRHDKGEPFPAKGLRVGANRATVLEEIGSERMTGGLSVQIRCPASSSMMWVRPRASLRPMITWRPVLGGRAPNSHLENQWRV